MGRNCDSPNAVALNFDLPASRGNFLPIPVNSSILPCQGVWSTPYSVRSPLILRGHKARLPASGSTESGGSAWVTLDRASVLGPVVLPQVGLPSLSLHISLTSIVPFARVRKEETTWTCSCEHRCRMAPTLGYSGLLKHY